MKNKLAAVLLTGLILGGPMGISITHVQAETTTSVKDAQGLSSKKRKRARAYKKPRKKKFLGIFKRRSSCDCPKH